MVCHQPWRPGDAAMVAKRMAASVYTARAKCFTLAVLGANGGMLRQSPCAELALAC
jgi:hypothetical protein